MNLYRPLDLLDYMILHDALEFHEFLGFLRILLSYYISNAGSSYHLHDIVIIFYISKADHYFLCSVRKTPLYLMIREADHCVTIIPYDISDALRMMSLEASI